MPKGAYSMQRMFFLEVDQSDWKSRDEMQPDLRRYHEDASF